MELNFRLSVPTIISNDISPTNVASSPNSMLFYAHLMPRESRKIHRRILALHKIASRVTKNRIFMQTIQGFHWFPTNPAHNYASERKNQPFLPWKKSRLCENFATSRENYLRPFFNEVLIYWNSPWRRTSFAFWFAILICQKFSQFWAEVSYDWWRWHSSYYSSILSLRIIHHK